MRLEIPDPRLAPAGHAGPGRYGNGNGNSGAGNNNGNNANRARGKTTGGYALIIAGQYTGTGTATVTDTSISISGVINLPDGSTANLTTPTMQLVNNRFTGAGNIKGNACTISGRVDLPSATDQETTDEQAITGRITATLTDSSGKTTRIVGIQNSASRGRGSRASNLPTHQYVRTSTFPTPARGSSGHSESHPPGDRAGHLSPACHPASADTLSIAAINSTTPPIHQQPRHRRTLDRRIHQLVHHRQPLLHPHPRRLHHRTPPTQTRPSSIPVWLFMPPPATSQYTTAGRQHSAVALQRTSGYRNPAVRHTT